MAGLTDTRIKSLKPREKPYKVADGRGLSLLITPAGGRLWRFRYRRNGREMMLGLGQYPDVSLADARDKRDDARRTRAKGIDPATQRKAEKRADAETFAAIGEELLAKKEREEVTAGTLARDRHRLRDFLTPYIGSTPMRELKAPDILAALKRIEARGKYETASRTRALAAQICRYAIDTGRADADPTPSAAALVTPTVQHFAAITEPAKVGALMRAIDNYDGVPAVAAALKLLPLVFTRPGELRQAEWSEFDLDGDDPVWRIPAERMKMRAEHLVPLARQAVATLRGLHALTGTGALVFPSIRTAERPISDGTLCAALRRMGYTGDEMVSHGFRSMASTLLHECGHASADIELQLAHKPPGVAGIYNRAARLVERRKMMQAWADYLDGLKAGGNNVVPINAAVRA